MFFINFSEIGGVRREEREERIKERREKREEKREKKEKKGEKREEGNIIKCIFYMRNFFSTQHSK